MEIVYAHVRCRSMPIFFHSKFMNYLTRDFESGFQMHSSGTHIYKRVYPSVRWSIRPSFRLSVRYACAKNEFPGCFWPRRDPMLNYMFHVLSSSFITQSFQLSVCPSVSPYMSMVQYTQRHSPNASLPGWTCFGSIWPSPFTLLCVYHRYGCILSL